MKMNDIFADGANLTAIDKLIKDSKIAAALEYIGLPGKEVEGRKAFLIDRID